MDIYTLLRSLLLLLLFLLVVAAPARSIEWQTPERLTINTVEDRTTSGSLFYFSSISIAVVWMQEQAAPGWRLMSSDLAGVWTTPAPVDPSGAHPDFAPRLSGTGDRVRHLVWQRGSGNAAEICYATGPLLGAWTIDPITSNATEDVTPDIADGDIAGDGLPHVVWAGYDPISGSGKIFHAVRESGGWQTERLAASELGSFWTGSAPRVTVDYAGIVHVVYRGGDFGDYHAHYARKDNGVWTYQVLFSGNANDLVADVATDHFNPTVAMSGNDGFGFPSHLYVRMSTDGGVTFQSPILASGVFSAVLDNITEGPMHETRVVGSEVSGNIYTGNLIVSDIYNLPEYLPPVNQASEAPCIENAKWIALVPGYLVCAYTNHGGGGADGAEVYVISTPAGGAVEEESSTPVNRVVLQVAPNPTRGGARIFATMPSDTGAHLGTVSIYDTTGRLVRKLTAGPDRPRSAHLTWDGRSAAGVLVTGGTYFLRLEGASPATTRLTVLR